LQSRTAKEKPLSLTFRVRIGDYEVEIGGDREDVFKAVEELPNLIANVGKAFENARPKKVTTLTLRADTAKQQKSSQNYPRISPTENCEENIMRTLQTDWGKWRPRTIDELTDALEANGQNYPARTLTTALNGLVKKGTVRRWNTDAGFVYILFEKETSAEKGHTE
jgi:predicted transcriptional regulator